MSLQSQIEEKLNQSLKNKDKSLYPTLRLIVSGIKDLLIVNRTKEIKEVSDQDVMGILKKMVKQRNESSEVYKKAGRTELLEIETKEIEIINSFLPKQLSEEDTKKLCEEVIKKAYKVWSLSPMTLPHGIVPILIIEQTYRVWSISKNHPYHR